MKSSGTGLQMPTQSKVRRDSSGRARRLWGYAGLSPELKRGEQGVNPPGRIHLNGAASVKCIGRVSQRSRVLLLTTYDLSVDEQRLLVSRAIYPLLQTHTQGLEEKDVRAAITRGIKEPQLAT